MRPRAQAGTKDEVSTFAAGDRRALRGSRRSAFQPRQKAGSVPALAAHLLDFRIEGIDQGCDRKARPIAPRFGKTNRQVLAHPLHRKTEIEFALVHRLLAGLHLPGLGGSPRDGFSHRGDIQTRLFRKMKAFRHRPEIMVVADGAHDKVLAFGGGFRRRCRLATELLGPCLRLGRRPVVHGDLVTTFFHQMSCHREAHNAETEKSDFSHVCDLGVLPALKRPDCMFKTGGGLVRCSKQVPLKTWKEHNKPCSVEGNASDWRAGPVLCYDRPSITEISIKRGVTV